MAAEYWVPLVCAVTAFAALWPVSVRRRDASIVDFIWGPGFALQIGAALVAAGQAGDRALLILALVIPWSARLGFTLVRRRLRAGREDPRYGDIRRSWDPGFWWKSLFIVFLLQAAVQWVIASGAIAGAVADDQAPGWLAWSGAALALAGLGVEAAADWQLDRFRRRTGAGGLLTTGLRRHVRHPNYAGEIVFWSGIAAIGLDAGMWLAALSPLAVATVLVLVSGAPVLNARLLATRPGYGEYSRRTPAFVPFLWPGRSQGRAGAPPGERAPGPGDDGQ